MLEPSWAREHDFDLMHVHFGFDHRTPAELRALGHTLAAAGRPLVLTLHDLRSPHQEDRGVLDAQLDALVPMATSLLTLTTTAAQEVSRRWGRVAEVVPHPHVVDLDVLADVRRRRAAPRPATVGGAGGRIGVALKSLRPNTDGVRLLPALGELSRRGHRVSVTLHRSTLDDAGSDGVRETVTALRAAHRRGEIELTVHEPLPDEALWSWVADLDVAVLPYRFGSHSGWLEMCHDLGTSVVAPTLGHYAAQGADAAYVADEATVSTDSLVTAVEAALARRAVALPGLDAAERAQQRRVIADTHDRVYGAALAAVREAA